MPSSNPAATAPTSSSFYLGMIQILEQKIKKKRKSITSRNKKRSISNTSEKYLEEIQSDRTNKEDNDIDLPHLNSEQKFGENCFLNKDECYEDKTFVAKSNLNSNSSIPHSVSSVYNNASEDETLHILDTFDTVTGYKKEVCNLRETAQKDTVSDVIQVDKLSKQAFPCRKQYV